MFGPGAMTLIISNDEMNDMKISLLKSSEKSGWLIKGIKETIKIEVKEQKGGPFSMLVVTVGASLSGNLASEGPVRAGPDFWCCLFLALTNLEIQKHY